ncbi:hypothetical protein Csa_002317, partial [Cucumis sativus]
SPTFLSRETRRTILTKTFAALLSHEPDRRCHAAGRCHHSWWSARASSNPRRTVCSFAA